MSQGLLLTLGNVYPSDKEWVPVIGEDVSDVLGIIKWNPPLPKELEGKARGRYPSFIPKTTQERVQNITTHVFSQSTDKRWETTLKLDGESCTFYHKANYSGDLHKVGVCSRTVDFLLDQDGNAMVDVFHKLGIAEKLPQYGNLAIQGELMGPGIHGNREGLSEYQYFVYDVWNIDGQYYLPKDERDAIITCLGLQSVPVVHPAATLEDMGCDTLEGMLRYADRLSMNHKVAEGVVFKAVRGSHVADLLYSFKCINNRYLLGPS